MWYIAVYEELLGQSLTIPKGFRNCWSQYIIVWIRFKADLIEI